MSVIVFCKRLFYVVIAVILRYLRLVRDKYLTGQASACNNVYAAARTFLSGLNKKNSSALPRTAFNRESADSYA